MDEREAKLPQWVRTLIAELRQQVQHGHEPILREVATLRPQVELLKRRNEALTELLECAARGGHMTANEIVDTIGMYSLQLVKEE